MHVIFEDFINKLLESKRCDPLMNAEKNYIGPIYACDTTKDKVEEFITRMRELTPWLTYFSGESKSGKEGYVGMYYKVHRENASFPRDRWLRKPEV